MSSDNNVSEWYGHMWKSVNAGGSNALKYIVWEMSVDANPGPSLNHIVGLGCWSTHMLHAKRSICLSNHFMFMLSGLNGELN